MSSSPRRLRLAGIAGLLLVVPASAAQQEEPDPLLPGTVVPSAGETGEEGSPAAAPSARQKGLSELRFDRRPSEILRVWATPPSPPDETEGEEKAVPPAEGEAGGEPTPEEQAAAAQAAEKKLLEAELALFQRHVTLGRWTEIQDYLASLAEEEGRAGYRQLLRSLAAGPQQPPTPFPQFNERNFFGPEDVVGLAGAAPFPLERADLDELGKILGACVEGGSLIERCVELLRGALDAGACSLTATQVARIVLEAGFPIEAGSFLPEAAAAAESGDHAALNLLARHHLARYEEDPEDVHLETAWEATQALLAAQEVDEVEETEALCRAVDIAPRIREQLGQAWLDESFTTRPGRGMQVLSTIGSAASTGLVKQAMAPEDRFKNLELQTTAANALILASPLRAGEWSATLNLLATNWLREAEYSYEHDTATSRGPRLQRDPYGNYFYYDYPYQRGPDRNMPQAITTDEMLDIRPSDEWLDLLDGGLQARIPMVTARLLLKVNEEEEAFPYIERIATRHPDRAGELVEEFLRVWSKNHNPNAEGQRTNPYMFVYGFEERANAIPLTRSKQERNLAELAEWVRRLRSLPIADIDEDLIADAFTAAHSAAEVFRLETIEGVFGSLDELGPTTLATLVQRMRSNLVGVWRQPSVQRDNKTRRRQEDIQQEILRGYQVARAVVDQALVAHPDHWPLVLARASVDHDENNFRQEVARFSEFTASRAAALEGFQRAAVLYAAAVPELKVEEESAEVYETWFYASLGACDLNAIHSEMQPVLAQLALIRDAIGCLPGEAARRHLDLFANSLFTRLSSVNPAVKFRYVQRGLEIAGESERATEAREVLEYYQDLVTEIQLHARLDGSDRVGHGSPFGVYVDIRHTREIEREAGGFAKYLVNQNNQQFAYNYGRPTEDYRDKFERAATEALQEHFEVLSITFNRPDTNSHADEEYGWRITPYAYLLLAARGPEVDRLPPLHLDLDFLDTSGYAILPVESSPVVLDARSAAEERPWADLEVAQTLDERQAREGRLVLEVRARAQGLVPPLAAILDLAPDGFDVVSSEDEGVAVTEFDEESGTTVRSERTWMIAMAAKEDLAELPSAFQFGVARAPEVEMLYQRYVDADLQAVEPTVALAARYGERGSRALLGWAGGALGAVAMAGAGLYLARRPRRRRRPAGRFVLPETISPFTVIGLLRSIEANDGISADERGELRRHIEDLESCYFRDDGRETPDLHRIAEIWVERVS
ncbi:MAG: hypothetical protein AB1726_12780 [Planctomycetota bacterium]